jgi:hypothetical protein
MPQETSAFGINEQGYGYDALGNLVREGVLEPMPQEASTFGINEQTYGYDALGNLVPEGFLEPMPGNTQEASTFGINEEVYGYDASGAGDPTTGSLGDWEQCSKNYQCRNGCCSGMYSGGVLKCTPLSGGFNPSICTAV